MRGSDIYFAAFLYDTRNAADRKHLMVPVIFGIVFQIFLHRCMRLSLIGLMESGDDMDDNYKEIARLMVDLMPCVALTGAGISAESGIPTFRSKGGLWEKYDPYVYASIDTFREDPSKYWTIRGEFIRSYDTYQPNKAHLALAELEKMGIVHLVITQNIDGLHKKAGSRNVAEIHGSLRETYCLQCGKEFIAPHVPEGMPPYCDCGGVLKPNTVLFGEQLPQGALETAPRRWSSQQPLCLFWLSRKGPKSWK